MYVDGVLEQFCINGIEAKSRVRINCLTAILYDKLCEKTLPYLVFKYIFLHMNKIKIVLVVFIIVLKKTNVLSNCQVTYITFFICF